MKFHYGISDLATVHPELLDEWDYSLNSVLNLSPHWVHFGTPLHAWWICSICGHSWHTAIRLRSRGHGCPNCAHIALGEKNSKRSLIPHVNDFATLYPDLAKEWDYNKNSFVDIFNVSPGSSRSSYWLCSSYNHSWKAVVSSRVHGSGCPYCSNKRVLEGFNDLAHLFPNIASEWYQPKNGSLLPNQVTFGYTKSVFWKCSFCGHVWSTSVANRTKVGTGCPECRKHYFTSFSEQAVFYFLKLYFSDVSNRYKFKDGKKYVEVDIYLPSVSSAVEYDGLFYHQNKQDNDNSKFLWLKSKSITLYRIIEDESNFIDATFIHYDFYHSRFDNLSWAIQTLLSFLNFGSLFVDVKAYESQIREFFYSNRRQNSFGSLYFNLLSQWHTTKNGSLSPFNISPFANFLVWWKCERGHEWEDSPNHRAVGRRCPYCSHHRAISGENDLKTLYSDVALQWDFDKNVNLPVDPLSILPGSQRNVWWRCPFCEKKKKKKPIHRVKQRYCPSCKQFTYLF